mmetsp:Transcript_3963/g.8119  ORF Transcript_3963/g.8119 Transcript_3963/m.8119 type:complete len:659 (-) Transcript_3963:173-2149(-)
MMSDTSDSSAKSDSTQWPSAPNSPANEMSDMQDILDRAMRGDDNSEIDSHAGIDPFESHPETYQYLRSNFQEHCRLAAREIHDAEILLVVTGAGFSADSGLATYLEVADIEAYSSKGWKYRDLCRPPVFSDLDIITGRLGDLEETTAERLVEEKRSQDEALPPNEAGEYAKVPKQHGIEDRRDLSHDDMEHPTSWYGFWMQCFNDYRRVCPHEGYDIIRRWARDKNFQRGEVESNAAKDIRTLTRLLEQVEETPESNGMDELGEPYYVSPTKRAGAFYFFTSNVDAHSYDVFESHEIRECHGNIELMQCHNFACGTNDTERSENEQVEGVQKGPWQRRLWRMPLDHEFIVDTKTMTAPYSKNNASQERTCERQRTRPFKRIKSIEDTTKVESDNEDANDIGSLMSATLDAHLHRPSKTKSTPAHIGDVHGLPRQHTLRNMRDEEDVLQDYFLPLGKDENWPRCPRCNEAARPAILMFDDLDWIYCAPQERRWDRWCHSLLKLCKRRSRNETAEIISLGSSTVSDDMSEGDWEDVSNDEEIERLPRGEYCDGTADVDLSKMCTEDGEVAQDSSPPQPLKVCILEIGCGYNVPTCRVISERLVLDLRRRGGLPSLIRINPLHPEPDDDDVDEFTISILGRGLASLKVIEAYYGEIQASNR